MLSQIFVSIRVKMIIWTRAPDGRVVTPVAQAPPRCTKCNSPPISGQCTNFVLFDVALIAFGV